MKPISDKASQGDDSVEIHHGCDTPLQGIESEAVGKSRITMRIDNDVLAAFKAKADKTGGSYQTMMNSALKQFAQGLTLSEMIRQAIHETLESCVLHSRCKRSKDRA